MAIKKLDDSLGNTRKINKKKQLFTRLCFLLVRSETDTLKNLHVNNSENIFLHVLNISYKYSFYKSQLHKYSFLSI